MKKHRQNVLEESSFEYKIVYKLFTDTFRGGGAGLFGGNMFIAGGGRNLGQ